MMNYLICQQLVCALPFETERNEKNFEEIHVFFLFIFVLCIGKLVHLDTKMCLV